MDSENQQPRVQGHNDSEREPDHYGTLRIWYDWLVLYIILDSSLREMLLFIILKLK